MSDLSSVRAMLPIFNTFRTDEINLSEQSQIRVNHNLQRKYLLVPIALFIIVFLIHAFSPVITLSDSAWSVAVADSVLHEFNTDLNEYPSTLKADDWRVEKLPNGDYSYLPIGSPLLAVPFVWLAEQLSHWWFGIDDLHSYLKQTPLGPIPGIIEQKFASVLVALTALFIYWIALSQLNRKRAIFVALLFAFCTSAWSTASRALWQHGPSMLMLSISLWLLIKAQHNRKLAQYTALPLALSYVIRPTNSISIVILSLYIFFYYRSVFIRYILWSLPVAIPFIAYNFSIYGAPLSTYYHASRIGATDQLGLSLLGNLVSPGRGVFIYSPIFLLALPVMWRSVRQPKLFLSKDQGLHFATTLTIILHWLAISTFPHWIGGWSLGSRLFTDIIPYWLLLLLPQFAAVQFSGQWQNLARVSALGLVALLSFLMHWHGAADLNVYYWNRVPNNIDEHQERIWDWRDPPFLRGFLQPLLRITPDAVQYFDNDQSLLQQVQLEISSLDTSRTTLKFVLPEGILPLDDESFRQQFVVVDERPDATVIETKEGFGFGQKRTIVLRLSPAKNGPMQSAASTIQLFITTRNIWWTRWLELTLPWQDLKMPYQLI